MNNKNNPNNDTNPLFRALTRLLSGPIVDRRKQAPRNLKRRQLNKYKFTSPGGLSFKKESYNPFDQFRTVAYQNLNRAERYIDFDQMEYMPEIASALDIYADEMTVSSPIQKLLQINCPNEEIKEVLVQLFYNVLNIEFNIFGWCRSMCKYGDFFLYLDIDETLGVQSIIGLPPMEIERMEGEDKTNPKYVQFQWNSGGLTFENWQIAHFRILGNDKYAPYGTSVLEACRRIFRQLQLLEDAMMAYRVVRSPERRVFYIDVGGIPEKEIEQHMQRIVTQMKRNQVIDAQTGRVDLRYNPMSTDEDYFIPVRGGSSNTRVESLPGGTYTGDVDDVKYLRDKLFSALKVPPSYLTQSEEGGEDKTTLAQKDVRFARTIQRLQRSVVAELEKIAVVHLYTLGYKGKDLLAFKLHLNSPSKIAELQELEHWRTKFEIAGAATEGYFSKRWVAKNLLNLSDEEIVRNQREMFYDKKFEAALEGAAEEDAAGGGEEGGAEDLGGGDEFGGGEDLGGEELGGEEEAGEDETLLAEPGKRNDMNWRSQNPKPHLTRGAKGKAYIPEKHDDREEAGRKKNMMGKVNMERGKNTQRSVFPGLQGLQQLSKGINESIETNYDREDQAELDILENNIEIQQIITNLGKRDNKKMAKFKHNKKKNSAFLYETLILELTKSILKKDTKTKKAVTLLIKESFRAGTVLYRDLKLYHSLTQTHNVHPHTAEKILQEVKKARTQVDKKQLVVEQNSLIRKIRGTVAGDVWNNFVPNYKSLATIYQIFNHRAPIKSRVLLENDIIRQMSAAGEVRGQPKMVSIDNLLYKTFTKKFNKAYSNNLLPEQKDLLSKFVSSFIDNGLQLKAYLNEEIKRLKVELKGSLLNEVFIADNEMLEKAKNIISVLESYKNEVPKKDMVQKIIKIQSLVHEISENGRH